MEVKTVWIIDDDLVSQFAMTYKIEQSNENYHVEIFNSAEKALAMIKVCEKTLKDMPNIILLDLVLPGLSGWDFLRELEDIQGHTDDLEIYIVSAFTNSMDRKLAEDHPLVIGYFNKPLNKVNVDQIFRRHKRN
ncbi:response regulator [Arenibacter certesii]|uniref:Response regulatory domain-containing protein n=1 Tax=Arenibacter certesii TaxID=228955 RepID=A0A918MI84_9FLAO|nr:response regulator [Arenibacter certesii]GGW24375.1 hypothetical protein GCM10007383_06010 [Arenibacter certesii]